ncbi:O-antigen/teichoic acid export membrane protein [Desulfobaculum xiamenense]|uniref:O-antigen/teichoic acid export membrane protein n=1 Tax=Desulfobaculum xiamenense TaxID=995050 RepID=A0A846QNS8_9BACT|nr:polysaccharide biosynthesis C-terminal domain-containing protein [Desulfobaculum xiamenense]NJB68670.1 O-antigen/teichoic acid export membrane protein [Desulfobaculum xiamenense]
MRSRLRELLPQWLAAAFVGAVSMLISFALGRVLGPVAFGDYATVLTAAALFGIAQDGGFRTLIYREGIRVSPSMARHAQTLSQRAVSHALYLSAIGMLAAAFTPPPYGPNAAAAVFCFGLQTLTGFVSSGLRADGRFGLDAAWQGVCRTTGALGIVAALVAAPSPAAVFIGWGAGLTLPIAIAAVLRPQALKPWRTPGWLAAAELRSACLSFLLVDAATTVYYKCDIILLRHMGPGAADTGHYAAAYRFLDGIVLLAAPVGVVWFRRLRQLMNDHGEFMKELRSTCAALTLAGAAILAAGTLAADWLVGLTFGPGYEASARLLPLLLASLVFLLPAGILTQAAIAMNMERFYAVTACLAAALNIALNVALIPRFAGSGAAMATIATECFLCVTLAARLRRTLAHTSSATHAHAEEGPSCTPNVR